MTGRTPRLSRLRRAVPEGRASRAGRTTETRGGKPRPRGAQPKGGALGGGLGLSAPVL